MESASTVMALETTEMLKIDKARARIAVNVEQDALNSFQTTKA